MALTDVTLAELDKVQKGAGTPEDKQRAMAVLLTQLIVVGGLTALSVQGARNARAVLGQQLEVVERQAGVGGQLVALRTPAGTYVDIFVPLYGEHQAHWRQRAAQGDRRARVEARVISGPHTADREREHRQQTGDDECEPRSDVATCDRT